MTICICGGTMKARQDASQKANRRLEYEACPKCGRTLFEKLYSYMGGLEIATGAEARKDYAAAIAPKPKLAAITDPEPATAGADEQ